MEEKLTKGQRSYVNMIVFSIIFLVTAIVLFIIFFLKGEITVSGNWPEKEKTVSTTCVSEILSYPFFEMNEANSRDMNIKVVASGDKITTIGLVYKLYYSDDTTKMQSRDRNHYAMNMAFNSDDMEADSLGAHYSLLADNFKFSLFADGQNINDTTAKYFMLDKIEDEKYTDVVDVYKTKGFKCTSSD